MHPHEIEDHGLEDFDPEKVWKKVFKKVECEFCSDDGDCSRYLPWNHMVQAQIKCAKWDDFEEPCPCGGVNAGTVSIVFPPPTPYCMNTLVYPNGSRVSYGT